MKLKQLVPKILKKELGFISWIQKNRRIQGDISKLECFDDIPDMSDFFYYVAGSVTKTTIKIPSSGRADRQHFVFRFTQALLSHATELYGSDVYFGRIRNQEKGFENIGVLRLLPNDELGILWLKLRIDGNLLDLTIQYDAFSVTEAFPSQIESIAEKLNNKKVAAKFGKTMAGRYVAPSYFVYFLRTLLVTVLLGPLALIYYGFKADSESNGKFSNPGCGCLVIAVATFGITVYLASMYLNITIDKDWEWVGENPLFAAGAYVFSMSLMALLVTHVLRGIEIDNKDRMFNQHYNNRLSMLFAWDAYPRDIGAEGILQKSSDHRNYYSRLMSGVERMQSMFEQDPLD